jgi:hypothetical protein
MKKQRKYTEAAYPKLSSSPMNSVIGTVSELRVSVDLFLRGYYVFRAMSSTCPFDLIGLKNGELTTFEVRTARRKITNGIEKIWCDKKKNAEVLAIVVADKIIYEPLVETFDS